MRKSVVGSEIVTKTVCRPFDLAPNKATAAPSSEIIDYLDPGFGQGQRELNNFSEQARNSRKQVLNNQRYLKHTLL